MDIPLELGAITEAVTVSGDVSHLETETPTLGAGMDVRSIRDLPLSGSNALTLVRQLPGMIDTSGPNGPNFAPATAGVGTSSSVSGSRTGSMMFSLDGSPMMSGPSSVSYVPPSDMLDEFRTDTSSYDAAFGRAQGAAVNISIRPGTNLFHGAVSWFHSDNVLQSLDMFQRSNLYNPATGPVNDAKRRSLSPHFVVNRGYLVLSGPVAIPKLYNGRNRLFWTFGMEILRRPQTTASISLLTVPTAAERQGDFSQLLKLGSAYQIYDPATIAAVTGGHFSRQPLPGNVIPASRLDPMAQHLLQYYPASNYPGAADGTLNYFSQPETLNNYESYTGRVDYHVSDKQRIFGRYFYVHQFFTSGQAFPDDPATGNPYNHHTHGVGLNDVVTFSPTFIMNLGLSMIRHQLAYVPNGMGTDLVKLGFPQQFVDTLDPAGITFPQIAISGYYSLGGNYPSVETDFASTAQGDLTKIAGNHTLHFGGQYQIDASTTRLTP